MRYTFLPPQPKNSAALEGHYCTGVKTEGIFKISPTLLSISSFVPDPPSCLRANITGFIKSSYLYFTLAIHAPHFFYDYNHQYSSI
jgi:hypothetical protein